MNKKINILFLSLFALIGVVFVIPHSVLADGPEFLPPACGQYDGNQRTCSFYTVSRDMNITPELTNSFVFVTHLRNKDMIGYVDQSLTNADYKLQNFVSTTGIIDEAVDKNYFNENGGINNLFTKTDIIKVAASSSCPSGYQIIDVPIDQNGNSTCAKEAAPKPETKKHMFSIWVVATDKYDSPSAKPGNLVPWNQGDHIDPFVQTTLGNPITIKILRYSPLGILNNKIIFYRSQEIYYINQGTEKTISRQTNLSAPTVQGIKPFSAAQTNVVTNIQANTTTTTVSATTSQNDNKPVTVNSPSLIGYIKSFFSGFGNLVRILFRF